METFTIEFTSLTCGPCIMKGLWTTWESYPIEQDCEKILRGLRVRYPKYDWRVKS